MIKKIIPVLLCICLSLAVVCYGENAENNQADKMPPMNQENMTPPENGEMPPMGEMPQKGEMPEGAVPSEQGSQAPQNAPAEGGMNNTPRQPENASPNRQQGGNWRGQGGMPSFGQNQGMQNIAEEKNFFETYFDAIMAVVLLILAYIFVIFYKRGQY